MTDDRKVSAKKSSSGFTPTRAELEKEMVVERVGEVLVGGQREREFC